MILLGSTDMGRVEHWCSPGVALERFDARAYSGPQQTGDTPAPPHHPVRRMGSGVWGRSMGSGVVLVHSSFLWMRVCPFTYVPQLLAALVLLGKGSSLLLQDLWSDVFECVPEDPLPGLLCPNLSTDPTHPSVPGQIG